ncbi:MAG: sulfotransferase [Alphaproteobacteria bacterium]|nr:sulfotransferase [Alphaproteobacteria bacterium]
MTLKPIVLLARDRLQKRWLKLTEIAMNRGLIPGHRDYVRFIILARGRVGSNLLSSYLNSHPGIVVKGEIFGAKQLRKAGPAAENDPEAHMNSVAFSVYPHAVAAVGFKLFYYHASRATQKACQIWPILLSDKNVKIIHLTRENILRTHLSHVIATKTLKWTQAGPINAVATAEKLTRLGFEECENAFIKTERWQNRTEEMFRDHPMHHVTYEQLTSEPEGALTKIQKFLGVEPRALASFHTKQNTESLRQLIQNYDELKSAFASTPWSRFFEE